MKGNGKGKDAAGGDKQKKPKKEVKVPEFQGPTFTSPQM